MLLRPHACIFIGLNAVRVLSIIGLILVFSSSIVTMVQDVKAVNKFSSASNKTLPENTMDYVKGSTVPNQPAGVFWAITNRLMIMFQVLILLLSEIGWPYKFFDIYFPVLGTSFGMGAIGLFQCFIGAAVLSHHVDVFALVSAFFLFSIGCLNILVGLIFREKGKEKRSILSWKAEKKKDLLPIVTDKIGERAGPFRPVFLTSQSPSFGSLSSQTHVKATLDSNVTNSNDEKPFSGGPGWESKAQELAAMDGVGPAIPPKAHPQRGRFSRQPEDDGQSHPQMWFPSPSPTQ